MSKLGDWLSSLAAPGIAGRDAGAGADDEEAVALGPEARDALFGPAAQARAQLAAQWLADTSGAKVTGQMSGTALYARPADTDREAGQ